MNDPVMGGKSHSTVEFADGIAVWEGEVAVVPFLNAPGFIQMITRQDASNAYPDVSACTSLRLTLMAFEPYSGYRVSFGTIRLPESRHAYGYKADFDAPVGEYGDVIIPFADFSAKWDEGTGDAMASCRENEEYCPDEGTLRDMETIAIWGEGVEGSVRLSVKSIGAVGCSGGTSSPVLKDGVEDAESSSILNDTEEKMESSSILNDGAASASEISIENFDNPSLEWHSMNDPVMGGESTGTTRIEDGIGIFDGEVVDVPFLHSPGFIQMIGSGSYPDVSACTSLQLNLMTTEDYGGYRVSFGTVHLPEMQYSRGYHADFVAPVGEFENVIIPFRDFSAKWDPGTGDQVVTCEEDSQYCPDENTLRNMETLKIWGEGVAGTVHLRVKSISAIGCSSGEVAPSFVVISDEGSAPVLGGRASSMSSIARKNSSDSLWELGGLGFVGFAALLALAVLNHIRSKRNLYYEVEGSSSVNEVV